MPNKTAVAASAALAASAFLTDLRSTPKVEAPVATTPRAAAAPSSSETAGTAATVSKPGTAALLTAAAVEGVSFSTKISADQSNCDPICKYSGVFTAINNADQGAELELKARLASIRGQELKAEIKPGRISIPSKDAAFVTVTITPEEKGCERSWTWARSPWLFSRPSPTGCMPAAGYCLIKVSRSDAQGPGGNETKAAAAKKTGAAGAAKKKPNSEPKVTQERIDLGVNVASPATLEKLLTLWSGLLAALATVATLVGLQLKRILRCTLAIADLDFDQSLVANISFTGVLLTAVGLNTVLPDSTQLMSKQAYAALGVFAAVLTLLAPAIFQLGRRRVKVDGKHREVGRVWVAAMAGGLLLWGALVQLGGFWFQLIEVSESHTISLESLALFSYLILGVAAAVLVYVPVSIITTAHHESAAVMPDDEAGQLALRRTVAPTAEKDPGAWKMP